MVLTLGTPVWDSWLVTDQLSPRKGGTGRSKMSRRTQQGRARIEATDQAMLRLTGAQLKEQAAGRGAKAEKAQAELARRKHNRQAKRAAA